MLSVFKYVCDFAVSDTDQRLGHLATTMWDSNVTMWCPEGGLVQG